MEEKTRRSFFLMVGDLYVSALAVECGTGLLKRLELTDVESRAATIWTTEMSELPINGKEKIVQYKEALVKNGVSVKVMERANVTTVVVKELDSKELL